ncbi:hypothetical protein [Actinoplanes sp. NBRC 103695]|uniref:hypothetical protein n=1 Tax=Actinoplanes sp. NBRC 103695 TaxID=3032202 RepID=UPI00255232F3|nr:hypothetical protein [Actinoplanes sp. NBRC 103695]
MTRRRHLRSDEVEPEHRPGNRSGVHVPPGAAAMLALQRQAGNVAVSRMLAAPERSVPPPVQLPELGTQPETTVPLEAIPRPPSPRPPSPATSSDDEEFFDALDTMPGMPPEEVVRPESPASTRTGSSGSTDQEFFDAPGEPMSPVRGSTDVLPGSRPGSRASTVSSSSSSSSSSSGSSSSSEAAAEQQSRWRLPLYSRGTGDKPKSVGAGVALVFPIQNSFLVRGTVPNLSSGATGMAAASSTGDAVSEINKWLQGRGMNWAKFLGGIATTGGLFANAISQKDGPAGDAARFGGLYTQTAGLIIKGYGESTKLEDGQHMFPDGDWSKAAGAFIAAAAPTLQSYAIRHQRMYEQMIKDGTFEGKIPVSNFAIAAAVLSGAAPAGDFASELVKAVRDRKVNIPKMLGGLFGTFGAVSLSIGIATDNNAAKYAGYGLQAGGLGFKSLGEYTEHEDRWPRLPQKERQPDEEEMQGPPART